MNLENASMKYARRILVCLSLTFPSVLSAQTYRVIDLGETESVLLVPIAIDDEGAILTQQHPLLDCEECTIELPLGVDGTVISVSERKALAISDNGNYVAGEGAVQTDIWQDRQALMAEEGTLHILGDGDAYAVNNLGQVVGSKIHETGFINQTQLIHSFIARNGVVEQIVPPIYPDMESTGFSNSWALGINNTGEVIGRYIPLLNFDLGDLGPDRAYLWQDGVSIDLTPLPEHRLNPRGGYAGAYDIDDYGLVVGWSSIFEITGMTAVMWSDGSVMSLGKLEPEDNYSFAWRINNLGQVVGWSGGNVFLWQDGEMRGLSELLSAGDATWRIDELIDLNNQGMILARASLSGTQHFVILEPVPEFEPPRQPGRPAHAPGPPDHAPGPPEHVPGRPASAPGSPFYVPGPPEHASGRHDGPER